MRAVHTASFAAGCRNVKINNVICIINPLKLKACIEVEYDVEVHLVSNAPQM